jgi:hypothetical protein
MKAERAERDRKDAILRKLKEEIIRDLNSKEVQDAYGRYEYLGGRGGYIDWYFQVYRTQKL